MLLHLVWLLFFSCRWRYDLSVESLLYGPEGVGRAKGVGGGEVRGQLHASPRLLWPPELLCQGSVIPPKCPSVGLELQLVLQFCGSGTNPGAGETSRWSVTFFSYYLIFCRVEISPLLRNYSWLCIRGSHWWCWWKIAIASS